IFAMWFASGAVMVFVPFPELTTTQRLVGMSPVDMKRVLVSPAAAITTAEAGDVERLRLSQSLDRPFYLLTRAAHPIVAVGADTAEKIAGFSIEQAAQIGARFAGRAIASVEGPFDYDQWVVHQRFDPYRPFFRVALADE